LKELAKKVIGDQRRDYIKASREFFEQAISSNQRPTLFEDVSRIEGQE